MNDSRPGAARHPALIYGLAMLVSLIGLGDSIYLTIQHLTGQSVRCTVTTGCSAVLSSHYATVAGVPTAAFGALAYFAAFSLATLAAFGYERARTALAILVAPMAVTTLWLLYVQVFALHAYCEYCLLSAGMTLTLVALVVLARFVIPTSEIHPQSHTKDHEDLINP
ncbi:MAG: vitamin K epoxide reductase family protein [Blastocatellia bacterium]|nr:vitamin K epoxide reductase family protein [Blastocatellia bacterium]